MRRYLDCLEVQGIYVTINQKEQFISRGKLGIHLRLSRLLFDLEETIKQVRQGVYLDTERVRDVDIVTDIINRYLEVAGVNLEGATGLETITAFVQVKRLNAWQWSLPFMTGESKSDKLPYAYEDHTWAWWVHKLASRYHWSTETIFNLWPEEAACYLQEVFVSEFEEMEDRRKLAEVAYRYDKISKTSKFIPTPQPSWMQSKTDDLPIVRVRRSTLPAGLIYQGEKQVTYH